MREPALHTAARPDAQTVPFVDFAGRKALDSDSRKKITEAYREPEPSCMARLLPAATRPEEEKSAIRETARRLVKALRDKPRGSGVEGLVHEYSLSSQEGVALMCLAEALLRIPDDATRDALIRDKIAAGDWRSHIGGGRSLFVNAATWGLVVTGRLTATVNDRSLASALTRLIARCGEPVIRRGVDMAMRMMGEQFVTGETIEEALRRAKPMEAKGFRYSYDMLGEAATTADDAKRYYLDYEAAIHAIGSAAAGRGVYEGPGISVKLSALHPRYVRGQQARVMAELLPRLAALARLAKQYDIGLNIDAEEADRLELSLDLLEALCFDDALAGWNGLGFVVQAYGKRCAFVLDHIIDLARQSRRRIMIRLVKGAYWDAEIKRAQLEGLEDFPVYTRKAHTDVSFIACAAKLLAHRDLVFPQFATHNAQTLASIYHMAGPDFETGSYEFQCLHGMGEPLYEDVVDRQGLARPARIYAPVGTHETLLAYLVRRLLENGANSSFVNRIGDDAVSVEELIADPVDTVLAMAQPGAKHDKIALPRELFGAARSNSAGLDLSNEAVLQRLSRALEESAGLDWRAEPELSLQENGLQGEAVLNPADHRDRVGTVVTMSEAMAARLAELASGAADEIAAVPPGERAAWLDRAADYMEERMEILMGLIMREAGKSAANAISEVREAVDFLRYYAEQAKRTLGPGHRPLGPILCISPWNFPLAIFTGQIAAALVAGNPVLAKPAEETPLIAAEAVRLLHAAGVPPRALQLAPGDGRIGAALVAAPQIAGVMFTGSTDVARLIQKQLAQRLSPGGRPIPLIAETGGQNAMIVDSSALAEQVVADVIASAFDSAGQRCSALRVLCLQEDVAERILVMLKGALAELSIGRTDRLSADIGPVITDEARRGIEKHIDAMRKLGRPIHQAPLPAEADHGTFVAPTIIELTRLKELQREVFGPVLHVIRYRRRDLDQLIEDINETGYGLTFGLHTRLDETIAHVLGRIRTGNRYVNRNIIGAVVGVQPFGGRGLSGTGPKAGGPLYLGRLVETPPEPPQLSSVHLDPALAGFARWLDDRQLSQAAERARTIGSLSALGLERELPGPVGERNLYALHPRGRILLLPQSMDGLLTQIACVLATGNVAAVDAPDAVTGLLKDLPPDIASRIRPVTDWTSAGPLAGALLEGEGEVLTAWLARLADLPGPLVLTQAADSRAVRETDAYCLHWLLEEVSTSINTAAAGGNASLMALG
ncbi:trifunctional transcriptional regulator/proline dehydrogenase/L-glutamate gamma-semialdehyde dehydrogenase [Rhizobium sp. SSA_523]|uniref:trifunctional transcriptional regulator/proline dehydrogenase/L-glutamate gamma-semialdehyde dehydrogenase n=1 Tax=Rhizobium sp. SSA_523 TaxID=2952477 RepID=UPI002091DF0D|nr:trifunctional transcriptional regulator/proline dehydrogenase/L-glutamate gamma-semialdehyde dehydrogenase [Rhizobium sp. SSA_523]MCO5734827.1 trifunctional transcriptional regulator/proline dehydrogenase/L-glutamate gamma-semialdehyde dehydrogenase [Rhizobium sp. SSA_523]WKC23443.1 trifunctional transcriptional regulator/proline dehydrogenase/L-glutamate gamma-semialdehyde dehydrogenase [Rhizobium sp. SSA_523]